MEDRSCSLGTGIRVDTCGFGCRCCWSGLLYCLLGLPIRDVFPLNPEIIVMGSIALCWSTKQVLSPLAYHHPLGHHSIIRGIRRSRHGPIHHPQLSTVCVIRSLLYQSLINNNLRGTVPRTLDRKDGHVNVCFTDPTIIKLHLIGNYTLKCL